MKRFRHPSPRSARKGCSLQKISRYRLLIPLLACLALLVTACPEERTDRDRSVTVDRLELLSDLEYLASDELEGRKTGTRGNRVAREFIEARFEIFGLSSFGESYRQPFRHTNPATGEEFEDAVNLIGYIEGSRNRDRYLVVTAHYDHLGVVEGEIYNGADDNASGTAGLLAAIRWFSEHPPESTLLFIAFDAEEQGLGGAYYFVDHPPVPLDRIVLNLNMDMIGNNDQNRLYAAGTWHYPFLRSLVETSTADAPVDVRLGYDHPDAPQDWTLASDHAPFHLRGIPFLYFGVEDHEFYHQPDDTFESINREFFAESVETIITVLRNADRQLEEIRQASGR